MLDLRAHLSSDVAVLVQGLQGIMEDLPSLLQHAQELVLQLVTHLYVLSVADGLQELYCRFMGRGTCEEKSPIT